MDLRRYFCALLGFFAVSSPVLLCATEQVPVISAVKVIGDSLSDGGTFGFKFTVQEEGKASIWVEQVAAHYGLSLCPYFSGKEFKTNNGCTNYAIGGGRINYLKAPNLPVSITRQMQVAQKEGFSGTDLLLVDGGANDSADLMLAFRNAKLGDTSTLQRLLESQLDKSKTAEFLKQGRAGWGKAAELYMQMLARDFASHIKTHLLAQGAFHIVLLNLPDVSKTPRFNRPELDWIKPFSLRWSERFNDELKRHFTTEQRVLLVDFYGEFNRQTDNPEKYGFSHGEPVCPVLTYTSNNAQYDLAKCTEKYLSANIPQSEENNEWWQRYMFSDDFHPTPYGHQQMANMVLNALKKSAKAGQAAP